MSELQSLIDSALELPHIPMDSAGAYQKSITELVKITNNRIESLSNFTQLTGGNSVLLVEDNHRNHAMFMGNVFTIGEYRLLSRTLPWVYKVYSARGFSQDYFPEVVRGFMEGVSLLLPQDKSQEILAVYNWILKNHESLLLISSGVSDGELPSSPEWLQRKTSFLKALLNGDSRECLKISSESVKSSRNIEDFYIQVIQPAMYEVGALWENNEISVAQEHLASAIVTRTIASFDTAPPDTSRISKRVVVTACAGEYHEIGAWMVSDHFESLGWQVRYLGANTPISDLMDLLANFRPSVLALSVTMPFNLVHAREVIAKLRGSSVTCDTKVLVGGRVFNENPELWESLGANGYAEDVSGVDSVIGGWDEPA